MKFKVPNCLCLKSYHLKKKALAWKLETSTTDHMLRHKHSAVTDSSPPTSLFSSSMKGNEASANVSRHFPPLFPRLPSLL